MCVCVCMRTCLHCIICVQAFIKGLFYYEKERNTPVNAVKYMCGGVGVEVYPKKCN